MLYYGSVTLSRCLNRRALVQYLSTIYWRDIFTVSFDHLSLVVTFAFFYEQASTSDYNIEPGIAHSTPWIIVGRDIHVLERSYYAYGSDTFPRSSFCVFQFYERLSKRSCTPIPFLIHSGGPSYQLMRYSRLHSLVLPSAKADSVCSVLMNILSME